ncbi:hypothetical protein Tco_0446517 [Tanacetum coccineum]
MRRTTRASSYASHGVGEDVSSPAQEAMAAPGTQPLDTNAGADEIASDGNVDSYLDARVSNTARDVLERDLLSFVPGPYYLPYPYDENDGCESPPYTKDDWDEIHGVNLGLRKKELYKDPKVCRTAIDRFPTSTEIYRLHELSSVELSDHMSVLQCQLITHGRAFHARYDHSLREVERLAKQCAQQTQIIKKQSADLKQHKESTVHGSEEVSGLKAELGALKSKCEATEDKLSSWDKKHGKYRSERDILAKEKAKIEEQLKSQLERRERQAGEIQGNITSFFQSDFTPLVRRFLKSGRAFHARYDHSLREVERLAKRCAQQTQIIKKQSADLKQHKESNVLASEEVSGLKAELGTLKSKCEATEHKLSSWDKKHRKYRSERDILAKEKAKIEEELKSQLEHRERQAEEIQGNITSFFQSDFTPLVRRFLKSSEFNRAFAGVLNTAISVGVERGLRMGRTDEEFRGLSQRVAGFIPDAKEKFDRVIAAFPDTTFPFLDKVSQHSQSSLQDIARLEPDRVTPSSQPSSATASLRTNTHARHSSSSSGTFGHTSTPEHLKKKKKSIERGGPSAV